jgi:hypothetical protein
MTIGWKPMVSLFRIFSFQYHRFLHRKPEILKWQAIVRQTFLEPLKEHFFCVKKKKEPLKQQRLLKLILLLQGSQTKIDENRKTKMRGCLGEFDIVCMSLRLVYITPPQML